MDTLAVSLWGVFTMPLCKTDSRFATMQWWSKTEHDDYIVDVAISAVKEEPCIWFLL